ncbi:hypothetical protein FUA23_05465 [Neolewinella aurantiaca]|uniref:Uncharacterized protein n=1 Tax=Neolewinella aurantiaca TaxID=2602767 RepID=A0A5C7FH29_9BACT|nr:hypothetical protein [Neolewinella aurantiaca]TXF90546.1 hypothetical protein FUA23_05465 [Neolewinella aurantiaca]
MKYILVLLLSLNLTTLSAQSSSQSVSEVSSDDGYLFAVKLDKQQKQKLLSAFEKITGNELNVKVTGLLVEEYENGTVVELNTRKNRLSVNYSGTNETAKQEARKLAVAIQDILNLAPAPAPPH